MRQVFGFQAILTVILLEVLTGCSPPQNLVLDGNLDIGSNGLGYVTIRVPNREASSGHSAYDAEIMVIGNEINVFSGVMHVFLIKEAKFDPEHLEKSSLESIAEARLTVESGSSSTEHVSAISSGHHVLVAVAEVGVFDKLSGTGKAAVEGVKRVARDVVYDDSYSRAKNSVQDAIEDVAKEATEFGRLDWKVTLSSGVGK